MQIRSTHIKIIHLKKSSGSQKLNEFNQSDNQLDRAIDANQEDTNLNFSFEENSSQSSRKKFNKHCNNCECHVQKKGEMGNVVGKRHLSATGPS